MGEVTLVALGCNLQKPAFYNRMLDLQANGHVLDLFTGFNLRYKLSSKTAYTL